MSEEEQETINDLKEMKKIEYNPIAKNNTISKDKIINKIDQIIKEHSEDLADKTLDLETKNIRTHQYNAMRSVLEDLLKEN